MNNILIEKKISNLHDNGKISFKKIKEMLSSVSSFVLEKGEIPKGKKILLSYSIKEGKIYLAENKTEIKNKGKNINEYLKSCEEMKEEISYSLNNLEKNIGSMNQEDQVSIFGPDQNVYYNIELLTKPEKCNNYNSKHFNIMPDGHGEYDNSGKLIINEVFRQTTKLQELFNHWQNKLKQERYHQYSNSIRKLKELHDKEYFNYASNKIDNALSATNSYINNDKFNLNDDSTIDDYMLSRVYILLNALIDKSQTGHISPISKMNIAKRILGIKGIGLQDITSKLQPEQQKFIKENILNDKNRKDLLNNAIKPIEDILINYSIDILKTLQSILIVNDHPSYKRINKQIDNSINYINAGNSLSTLKNELKSLKYVDNYLNKKNSLFFYDGESYSPSGEFKPVNELLKMFKPFSENVPDKKIIDENDIYAIINETITKKGSKYCLLSKKTKRNLGCYNSKSKAKNRERQVQYFKHMKEMSTAGGAGAAIQGAPMQKDKDKLEQ